MITNITINVENSGERGVATANKQKKSITYFYCYYFCVFSVKFYHVYFIFFFVNVPIVNTCHTKVVRYKREREAKKDIHSAELRNRNNNGVRVEVGLVGNPTSLQLADTQINGVIY